MSTEIVSNKDHAFKAVHSWAIKADLGFIAEIDHMSLELYLSTVGAREVINPEDLEKLSAHTLKKSYEGLRAVWGDQKLDSFEVFLATFIMDYNRRNRRLPRAEDSHNKEMGIGMRRFLLEFTQYAFGLIDFEDFEDRVKASVENGELWKERKDGKRILLHDPETDELKRVPVIASGFIPKFFDWLECK